MVYLYVYVLRFFSLCCVLGSCLFCLKLTILFAFYFLYAILRLVANTEVAIRGQPIPAPGCHYFLLTAGLTMERINESRHIRP